MKTFDVETLLEELQLIHDDLRGKTENFKKTSTIDCLRGCGQCCLSNQVEAFPGEWLPLAIDMALGKNHFFGSFEDLLEQATTQATSACVMYRPNPHDPAKGYCSAYQYRPLFCRLFGFASTRTKHGQRALITCRKIKEHHADVFAKDLDLSPETVPSITEYQQRVESLLATHPTLGQFVPINQALAIALEYVGLRQFYGSELPTRAQTLNKNREASVAADPQLPDGR